jgi:hypothetical protein
MAPVKAKTVFIQIGLKMFSTEAVIRAQNKCFGVGSQDMHPFENVLGFASDDELHLVAMAHLFGDAVRLPAIGSNRLASSKACLKKPADRLRMEGIDDLHFGVSDGLTMGGCSDHYGDLLCASASFTALGGRADVGVVDLDETRQLVVGIAIFHGSADLMKHRPGDPVADGELLGQLQSRDSPLVVAGKENRPEPFAQRCSGFVHHRPRGHRTLILADLALIKPPLGQLIVLIMTTMGTDKPMGPSHCEQSFLAVFLGSELPLKLNKGDVLIRFCHVDSSL